MESYRKAWTTVWSIVLAVGLAAFLGGIVLVLVLALFAAATFPPVISWCYRLLGKPHRVPDSPAATAVRHDNTTALWHDNTTALWHDRTAASRRPEPALFSQPVRQLSEADLCRIWRCTYLVVIRASTAHDLNRLGTLRGDCLDELERRDPAAFAAWVKSGARASGDPEKFFAPTLKNPRKGAV
ncbi:hypothetical protein [Arthrobacter sp. TMN-50]